MINSKMKTLLVMITLFLLIQITPTIQADPTVMVTDYTLDPQILMPGDEAELSITLTNTEATGTHTDTDYINNLAVDQVIDTIAASIDKVWINADGDGTNSISAEQIYTYIGDLSPANSITLSFKIIADENIAEGLYYPTIRVDVDDYKDVKYPFPVRVDNQTVTILHDDVPSEISIGGSTDISFQVINNRKNTIYGVTLSNVDQTDFSCTPNSIFIGSLDAGESEEVQLAITPSEMGEQILSLNLTYKNGHNRHYETYSIPIEVIEILDVAPIFTNIPYSIKKGSSSRIGLEVYNAKTESITGVIITPITDATVIPSQYFIGAMDADDVFSASFDIYTDQLDYGNHTIQFKVSYKQAGEYYETPTIDHSFSVTSGEGTSYLSSTNGNGEETTGLNGELLNTCIIIIVAIVILAVVIILWRWKKGRKNP
jgi:hypothetical protein